MGNSVISPLRRKMKHRDLRRRVAVSAFINILPLSLARLENDRFFSWRKKQ